jgi:hypothetical protein
MRPEHECDLRGDSAGGYLTMHDVGVPPIPDGLFIPLGVEVIFRFDFRVIRDMV